MIVSLQRPKACAEKRIRYPLSAHQIGQDERLPSLETCHAPSCPIVLRYAMEHYNLEKDIASDLRSNLNSSAQTLPTVGHSIKHAEHYGHLWTVARHSRLEVWPHLALLGRSPLLQLCWEPWQLSQPSAFHRQKMNTCSFFAVTCSSSLPQVTHEKELLLPLGRQILADFFLAALECFELRVKSHNY